MPAAAFGPALRVRGMRELQAALAQADRGTRLGVRRELRELGRPVQQDAQALALGRIPGMARSPQWAGMRVGVTRTLVYVAPKQRGRRNRQQLLRPNLAGLMMDRAMEPALERNEGKIERNFEEMIDRVADRFNHGP